ncbi:YceI family protein [Salipiger sp. H15]|uniref:YceI family protein n=1 Tax=Alloyangia sp. H15 TaxID=3029062 RepID=A0AAU8ALQ5_9RHOB
MTPLLRICAGGMRAVLLALALALPLAVPAAPAAARHYLLDGPGSQVGFATDFGPGRITGTFPVSGADLELDFADVARSKVSVTLDVSSAQASFPFAAQAMKGPKVLDARHYPTIAFRSTQVRRNGAGAVIDGALTLRGTTQPVSLRAVFARPVGSDPSDLDHLLIWLTGAIRRSAFGATGWPDAVGDEVRLDITARIVRAD